MNPNQLSPAEIRLRERLTIAAAGLGFLATNDTWVGLVGKIGLMLTGLILIMLQAWRSFIDKSQSQGDQGEQAPVPIINAPGDSLKTEEVAPDAAPVEPDLKEPSS